MNIGYCFGKISSVIYVHLSKIEIYWIESHGCCTKTNVQKKSNAIVDQTPIYWVNANSIKALYGTCIRVESSTSMKYTC